MFVIIKYEGTAPCIPNLCTT